MWTISREGSGCAHTGFMEEYTSQSKHSLHVINHAAHHSQNLLMEGGGGGGGGGGVHVEEYNTVICYKALSCAS